MWINILFGRHSTCKTTSQHFTVSILVFLSVSSFKFVAAVESNDTTNSTTHSANIDPEAIKKRILSYFKCSDDKNGKDGAFCQPYFDGYNCWPSIAYGQQIEKTCADVINSPNKEGYVRIKCSKNNVWIPSARHEIYKECDFQEDLLETITMNETIDHILLTEQSYENSANRAAYQQCLRNVILQPDLQAEPGEMYCPRVFDGWGCWNDTQAGTVATTDCPSFVPGFDKSQLAHRVCEQNGTWFTHPGKNDTWSNYTTCVDQDDLLFRQRINHLYISGYSISLVTLIISTFIFFYFRSLNCARITIHKNFFFSFIINNTLWIIWYTEVTANPVVVLANAVPCRFLHAILHYFLLSNYMWMFCEGFYLHTILVITFIRDDKIIKFLYIIGWGLPVLFISIYVGLRVNDDSVNTFCWIEDSRYKWVLIGPVGVSLLLNLAFLINIIRLLVTKVRSVNNPDNNHSRKAVRATLILIPLLGLNYILTPFRPETKTTEERVYEVISAIATSFQGLFVSLLLCFFNSEVRKKVMQAVQRKWNQKQMMYSGCHRMSYPNTTITMSANYDLKRTSPNKITDTKLSPSEDEDYSKFNMSM